tara:strand:+ start:4382 stop:5059 length:678 start_codon:yes stop_codon:yes gene_type:complete
MANGHYKQMGAQSVLSTTDLFQGFWSHVDVVKGGFKPKVAHNNEIHYLGVVNEGALEISREDTEFLGTTFPQVVELLTPSQVGMKFSGQLAELQKVNLRLAIGKDIDDNTATSDSGGTTDTANNAFIYPGSSCKFDDVFVGVRALRERCDGFIMDMMIHKTIASGTVTIGGAAEVINTPVEFNALDDRNGELGGTSQSPLGWLYAPNPTSSTTDATLRPSHDEPA